MSRGCPVVSYDIKYGPREQITDGVDGFLTPAEDLQTFADRVVTMIRDPALVEKMSAAALEKAQQHDYRAFLRDWRTALETAVANKPNRVQLDRVDLRVARLGRVRAGRLPRRLVRPRARPAALRKPPEVELDSFLHLHGKGPAETLDSVAVTLDAVCDATGGGRQHPGDRATRRAELRRTHQVRRGRGVRSSWTRATATSGSGSGSCGTTRAGRPPWRGRASSARRSSSTTRATTPCSSHVASTRPPEPYPGGSKNAATTCSADRPSCR